MEPGRAAKGSLSLTGFFRVPGASKWMTLEGRLPLATGASNGRPGFGNGLLLCTAGACLKWRRQSPAPESLSPRRGLLPIFGANLERGGGGGKPGGRLADPGNLVAERLEFSGRGARASPSPGISFSLSLPAGPPAAPGPRSKARAGPRSRSRHQPDARAIDRGWRQYSLNLAGEGWIRLSRRGG